MLASAVSQLQHRIRFTCGLIKNIMGVLFDFVDYAGHFILI
jgi:hypothetical protein